MKPTWVRPALAVMAVSFVLAVVAVARSPACGCCVGVAETSEASDFGAARRPRLIATVLPFAVLGGIVAFIYYGPPVGRRSGDRLAIGRAEPANRACGENDGQALLLDRINEGL